MPAQKHTQQETLLIALNEHTLTEMPERVRLPGYDRRALRTGIAHFGVGNFHRVHQAPIIDDFLGASGDLTWGITGIGATASAGGLAKQRAYEAQDGLYTITELTPQRPQPVRVIGAMHRYLHAPTHSDAVQALLAAPATRIVSLTITEGGYDGGSGTGAAVFAAIARGLSARRERNLAPFTVLSCDNLPRNGDAARTAALRAAEAISPDLARWIEAEGAFPNSMVDRIAPKVGAEDRPALNAASGIDDAFPATHETYSSWVIEDRFCAGRPALAGPIEFRDDAAAFVQIKGRLSNAAHMLMCYPSLLLGHRKVHAGMTDPRIPGLIRKFWSEDAVPLVSPPSGFSIPDFTQSVLSRFGPAHQRRSRTRGE